jgi:hypothetical protein
MLLSGAWTVQADMIFYTPEDFEKATCRITCFNLYEFPRNAVYAHGDAVPVSSLKRLHLQCERTVIICIPASVEVIGESLFSGVAPPLPLHSISVEFGSRLREIGQKSLSHCWNLRSFCVPASVESLGPACFEMSANLASLVLESGSRLTRIGPRAFSWTVFSSICIPASVEFMDGSAFSDSRISRLTLEEGNSHFRVSGGYLLDFDGKVGVRYFGNETIVAIPREIQRIGVMCFCGNHNLRSVCIPLHVQCLGEMSFKGCTLLATVTFESGSNLCQIESEAFFRCFTLRSICIPAAVAILGSACFAESTLLVSVTFESWSKLTRIEEATFAGCLSLSSICLPASVEVLCCNCFARCSSLERISFEPGSHLSTVDENAFADCPPGFAFTHPIIAVNLMANRLDCIID